MPLCPPQISHRDMWDQTQTSAVTGQQEMASAMAQPLIFQTLFQINDNRLAQQQSVFCPPI